MKSLSYSESLPDGDFAIIDVRPEAACKQETLEGAICIPPEQITTPARRLANFSGILWLLGTAALDGTERVVVAGRDARRKDFMAGILHLAGQAEVQVLVPSIESVLNSGKSSSAGRLRSNIRTMVFKSRMRSGRIILRNELMQLLGSEKAVTVLDGRSEPEYWGHMVRGGRGGHIPGAVHNPLASLVLAPPVQSVSPYVDEVIAYAHDSPQSIAYYARLTAHGMAVKVLHEGWAGWAHDGSLPVDAASFPDRRNSVKPASPGPVASQAAPGGYGLPQTLLISLLVMLLLIFGAFAGCWLRDRDKNHHG